MLGEVDTFEFDLARMLHKTVAEMRLLMPNTEYQAWISYFRTIQAEGESKGK